MNGKLGKIVWKSRGKKRRIIGKLWVNYVESAGENWIKRWRLYT